MLQACCLPSHWKTIANQSFGIRRDPLTGKAQDITVLIPWLDVLIGEGDSGRGRDDFGWMSGYGRLLK